MKAFSAGGLVLIPLLLCCAMTLVTFLRAEKPAACTAPEYREFDFWVGDWDTYDVDAPSKVVARNRVELILDRCVIHEIYDGFNGSRGESFSIYDSGRHLWHQSWVTNRGQLLLLDGRMEGGTMMLQGIDRSQNEGERLIRGIWKPVTDGVRETAEVSSDHGKTWQPLFDIIFGLTESRPAELSSLPSLS